MDLAEEHLQILRAWASSGSEIRQVRLFGSRAKGTSKQDSDVDLAVTIRGRNGETPWGIWALEYETWEEKLQEATGLTFEIKMYDQHHAPDVFKACEEHGILIYDEDAITPKQPSGGCDH